MEVVPTNGLCLICEGWLVSDRWWYQKFQVFLRTVVTRLGKQRLLISMKIEVRDHEFMVASEHFLTP